jgi:hypothetical protein
LDLDADDAGQLVECPACLTRFTAPGPDPLPPDPTDAGDTYRVLVEPDDRPTPARPVPRDPPGPSGYDSREHLILQAKAECSGPGSGLVVIGVLTLLHGLWRTADGFARLDAAADVWDYAVLGYGVYSLAMGPFWVYVGVQMVQARQWGVCLIGCATILLPVVSPCCLLGFVSGVSGLSKLRDERVKRGFDANRPGFNPDTPT